MNELEPKKLALLRILQILWEESDIDHPLPQEEIARKLQAHYGIVVERKAIGRNLSLLREAGFEIATAPGGGSYLVYRLFEESELRLLIDGVLASRHVSASHSAQLIEKICQLSNRYFPRHLSNIHSAGEWNRTEQKTLFYHIELVDEAIEQGRMLEYTYQKYGADKKLHRSSFQRVSPYQLILHNQRYYLMAYSDRWDHLVFHRMDRIAGMRVSDRRAKPLREVKGCEDGINYRELTTAMPYMYAEQPARVTFRAAEWLTDQIVDWFGRDISIREVGEKMIEASVHAAPTAMLYWALQYSETVEVLSPPDLRARVRAVLEHAAATYAGKAEEEASPRAREETGPDAKGGV